MSDLYESCYDCDGFKISYRYLHRDNETGEVVYEATCRECGASWETTEADE